MIAERIYDRGLCASNERMHHVKAVFRSKRDIIPRHRNKIRTDLVGVFKSRMQAVNVAV